MNTQAPFLPADLEELHARLYAQADRVVPMHDISKGDVGRKVIGLRHDVDDNKGSFDTALRMAEWEMERGISSTWFLLHDSHYWGDDMLCRAPLFEEMGHEVGIHVNAIAEGLRQDRDPAGLLADALSELRTAVRVVGCVAHGDRLCHDAAFVNDEMFVESARDGMGDPDREIRWNGQRVKLQPLRRDVFGLEYDANWLPRGRYLSESGGRWRPHRSSFEDAVETFGHTQLHVLVHPDWWGQAVPAGVRV